MPVVTESVDVTSYIKKGVKLLEQNPKTTGSQVKLTVQNGVANGDVQTEFESLHAKVTAGDTALSGRMDAVEGRFDENGDVKTENLPITDAVDSNTGVLVASDTAVKTAYDAATSALSKIDEILDNTENAPYPLGDGELSLFVRPDGDDSHDGLADSPERAWASIDHAVEWINARRFTGKGWITVRVADGTYTATGKRSPLACNEAQFADIMATFPDGPVDPTNPQMHGSSRIVLVGNVANPSAVRYVIPSSLPLLTFAVSGCGVYGLTLSIQPGASSRIRGAIVHSFDAAAGYMANCILEAGPDTGASSSPYTAIRGRGRLTMYGNITIRSTSTWNPYYLWCPEDGASYNFGHYSANMAGSGGFFVESPLKCTVESSVMALQKAYYATTMGAPTTGFVRVAGSTISIANPPEYRYEIAMPNVFQSYGAGGNFFPGKNAGIGSVPSSLYL